MLGDIEGAASHCWRAWDKGRQLAPGMTRVVFGAPGAGKSSTLMHLQRNWQNGQWCTSGIGCPPQLLRLTGPERFEDFATLREKLDGLLSEQSDSVVATAARKGRKLAGRLLAVQTPVGGLSIGEARRDLPVDPVARVLKQHPPTRWSRPLVIAIDEFQTISGDMHSTHAGMLRSLHHSTYDAPIVLLLAGLGDTVARARELGLSRFAQEAEHSLGCLAPEESADLIAGWGRHFGLRDRSWQGFMRDLAVECDHWPVHVQNALSALAEEIIAREGDMSRLDLAAVGRRSGELQRRYYASRMSPRMQNSDYLLAAVMRDLRSGMKSGEIMDAINELAGTGTSIRWRLPKGMDEEDYYQHLVHHGALQADAFGHVSCPIPSFRRYMVALGEAPAP